MYKYLILSFFIAAESNLNINCQTGNARIHFNDSEYKKMVYFMIHYIYISIYMYMYIIICV